MEFLKPIQEKRKFYEEHPEIVDEVLIKGTENAKKIASQNMEKIKSALMIDYFK